MSKKTFGAEDIINKLREAEVFLSQGETVAEISKAMGFTCCRRMCSSSCADRSRWQLLFTRF